MKMTTAEKMRELVKSTEKSNAKNRIEKHKKYVQNIINKKIAPLASKGKTEYKMKVPRKMFRVFLNDELIDNGFKTRYLSVYGTEFIVVSW